MGFTCFGHLSRKNSQTEDGLQKRASNASSSALSTQESGGPLARIACLLRTESKGKDVTTDGTPCTRTSSDTKDLYMSRWTSSSSGASSAKSIGMGGTFYSLDRLESPRNFMPSSQLAQHMRDQSSTEFEDSCLDPWMSMSNSSTMQPAPSWATNSWEIDPNDVQICLDSKNRPWQLGSGGFGSVFRAEMAGSTPVAVKFVTKQNPKELRRFVHEIGILRGLRHVNITQFLGAFMEGQQMILVTEFLVGGDLFDVIGHDLQQNFSWYRRGQMVALDVVRGLVHMHGRRVIHLDLKSANILLARDGTAKIADVGLAKVLSRECTQASMQSTFDWAAPEVLAGQTCSDKADIWSLGVVLWEIASGEAPKLRQLRPLNCPEECPTEVRDLIVACRASNPDDRPDAREVFKRLSAAIHSPANMQRSCSSKSNAFDIPSPVHSQSFGRRPSWAIPDEGLEGGNSFMAAIHEDEAPLQSAGSIGIDKLQGLFSTGSTNRKMIGDMRPQRLHYKTKNRMSRDFRDGRRSLEELRSSERATSL